MVLNVVTSPQIHSTGKLHINFGITEFRSNELALQMDGIVRRAFRENFSYADMLVKIAGICHTNEELVWCTIVNHSLLLAQGVISY